MSQKDELHSYKACLMFGLFALLVKYVAEFHWNVTKSVVFMRLK